MITGRLIKAGRILSDVDQATLAAEADIAIATLSRLEGAGAKPVHCHSGTLVAVLAALKFHGVAMVEGGVMLIRKAESAQGATRAAAMAIDFE